MKAHNARLQNCTTGNNTQSAKKTPETKAQNKKTSRNAMDFSLIE